MDINMTDKEQKVSSEELKEILELRKVRLLKPHKHGGVRYNKGDEIELTKRRAVWLYNLYVAERIEARERYHELIGDKLKNSDEVKNND